jgi:hypothetical protein
MSGTTGTSTGDRQRLRAARGNARAGVNRMPAPPRQRRPALAAIALILIVGGALVAGLLAIRMDSRVDVIAVSRTVNPGEKITADMLTSVRIASDDRVRLIGAQYSDQIVGDYAKGTIYKGMLLDQQLLTKHSPVGNGRAIVSVLLNPALTPAELSHGDLVQVVRAADSTSSGVGAKDITQGLVLSVRKAKSDSLGGASSGSVSLLVPESSAKEVIDASRGTLAGLALLSSGNTIDVIPGS